MAHFEDLQYYQYAGRKQPGVLHVGWLGRGQPYSHGPVRAELITEMKRRAESPMELYRGYHVCELCEMPTELCGLPFPEQWEKWAQFRKSNGEIRVQGRGVIYAAPVLITHYIEAHGYQPPQEFLDALENEN
jgi:hypothetical protein